MNHIVLKQLLFIDIETVPAAFHFNQLGKKQQNLWAEKVNRYQNENIDIEDLYKKRAGILAEFGQIICIAVGFVTGNQPPYQMRIKAFASKNEKEVLLPFIELLNRSFQNVHQFYFCGHNIKEFDIPYICRRIVINGLPMPNALNLSGLKHDIAGKDVARVFWEEDNLERIVAYCKKDVATVVQVMLRFKQQPLLKKEDIVML